MEHLPLSLSSDWIKTPCLKRQVAAVVPGTPGGGFGWFIGEAWEATRCLPCPTCPGSVSRVRVCVRPWVLDVQRHRVVRGRRWERGSEHLLHLLTPNDLPHAPSPARVSLPQWGSGGPCVQQLRVRGCLLQSGAGLVSWDPGPGRAGRPALRLGTRRVEGRTEQQSPCGWLSHPAGGGWGAGLWLQPAAVFVQSLSLRCPLPVGVNHYLVLILASGSGGPPRAQVESHAPPGLPSLPLTSTHGCGQARCQRLARGFGDFGCLPRNVQAPGPGRGRRVHAPRLCAFACGSAEAGFLPATWACTSLPDVGAGKARCPLTSPPSCHRGMPPNPGASLTSRLR